MKNEKIIEQIEKWQKCDYVHALTCGSNTCDNVALVPIEKDGIVILVCPTKNCDYKQSYLPECVLSADVEGIEDSIGNIINKIKRNN